MIAGRCAAGMIVLQFAAACCVQNLPLWCGVLIAEVVIAGGVLAAGAVLGLCCGTDWRRNFCLHKTTWRMCLCGAAAGICFPFVSLFITKAWQWLLNIFALQPETALPGDVNIANIAVLCVTGLLFSPFAEEIIWRGWVLDFLMPPDDVKRSGVEKLFITAAGSIFFALIHVSLISFLSLLFLGILLGILRITGKSVVPCIIMHFCNNAVVLLVMNVN